MSKAKNAVVLVVYLCAAVAMTAALWWGAISNFDDRIDGDHGRLLISALCFVNAVGCTLGLLIVALMGSVWVYLAITPADPPP